MSCLHDPQASLPKDESAARLWERNGGASGRGQGLLCLYVSEVAQAVHSQSPGSMVLGSGPGFATHELCDLRQLT